MRQSGDGHAQVCASTGSPLSSGKVHPRRTTEANTRLEYITIEACFYQQKDIFLTFYLDYLKHGQE